MFQSKDEALLILRRIDELSRRIKVDFKDPLFHQQNNFVEDDTNRVALLATRRAGKSYGVGLKLFRAALNEPMSSVLYLGLTRATSKRIMWKDVVKDINRRFQLKAKFNESELTATMANGSVIYFAGADSTRDEMEKVLGGKLKLAVIDEAGSFRQDLRKLCYEMIEPALSDYDGTLCMVGTPTDLLNTLFHKITDPSQSEPGWQVHRWNTFDNPYMKDNWKKRLSVLKETQPNVETAPFYRRMYLGEWVTDLSSLVYKFNREINTISKLPWQKYSYCLGIDLGFNDPTAFVVMAYSEEDNVSYVVECYKKSNMIISDVAERISYYMSRYFFNYLVVDNAAKQSVEELRQRYGFPLQPAEKQGKAEFIEIMNSEMLAGRIKVLPEAEELIEEWNSLIWDDKAKNRVEHPSCDNHLCFVAGTMISTPTGKVPIESLKKGDTVSTRFGPQKVNYCISSQQDVIKLDLSQGDSIWTTKDHPFLVNEKWVPAKELIGKVVTLEKQLYSKESHTIDGQMKSILNQLTNGYIEKFGLTIMAQSKKACMFIMLTVIQLTTTLKTYSVSTRRLIMKCIAKKDEKDRRAKRILIYLKKLGRSLRNGMQAKREENGIVITVRRRYLTLLKSIRQNVTLALKNTSKEALSLSKQDVVQGRVLPQKEETRELMTSQENVYGAKKDLEQINTQNKKHVPGLVLAITEVGMKKVYNLNVDSVHEYYANGVVVSNCDAGLYAFRHCLSYLYKPIAQVMKTDEDKVNDWFERQAEKLSVNSDDYYAEEEW